MNAARVLLLASTALLVSGTGLAARQGLATRATAGDVVEHFTQPSKGKFLVASRSIRDPNFAETIILLVDHDLKGSLGVVVNRPSDVPLLTALPTVKELERRKDLVFLGGPVQRDHMILLLRASSAPPDSVNIFGEVYASGSLETLRHSLAHDQAVRAYVGYAGWGPGQLDAEVARGDWLIGPADARAIFDERATKVWDQWIKRLEGDWARVGPLRNALAREAVVMRSNLPG